MNETMILQNLEAIAEKLSVKVQYENIRKRYIFSKGGLYRLREDKVVIIDNTLNLSEKIDILADALSEFDLEGIFMPPAVRKILASRCNRNTLDDKGTNEKQEETESKE